MNGVKKHNIEIKMHILKSSIKCPQAQIDFLVLNYLKCFYVFNWAKHVIISCSRGPEPVHVF